MTSSNHTRRDFLRNSGGAGLTLLSLGRCAVGDDARDAKDEAEARLSYMKKSVAVYAITPTKSGPKQGGAFRFLPDPLLRWNNPVSNVPDGALFLWLDDLDRPAIAAQVFIAAGTKDLWLHEFQSLSTRTFVAERDASRMWFPDRPGVEMKSVPDVPAPAKSKVGRLTQMRDIAKRLEAVDHFEGKSRWELRLLSTPLHRYGDEKRQIVDGALFAYAHGTDPEALLLLEAHSVGDSLEWRFGLAPMTGYALQVKDRGTTIWSAEHRPPPFKPTEPFMIVKYVP